jgi:DNA-binding NarL/FixJ family response regulator
MVNARQTHVVLLLEPSPFWLEAVAAVVQRSGFSRVLKATSAEQAGRLIRRHRPSLLLYGLADSPDDRAWEGHLASLHRRFPNLKIIVLSAVEDDEAIATARSSGVFAYVLRRADPDDLRAAIHQVFQPTIFQAQPVVQAPRDSGRTDVLLTPRSSAAIRRRAHQRRDR